MARAAAGGRDGSRVHIRTRMRQGRRGDCLRYLGQRSRPSARTAAADAANSSPGRGGTHRLGVADHTRDLGFNEALERLAIPEFDAVRCRNGDDILAPKGRQYATHGFDRQAEIVGDIIA